MGRWTKELCLGAELSLEATEIASALVQTCNLGEHQECRRDL